MKKNTTLEITKTAIFAALYVVLGIINPMSFGALQFRFAEMLNPLAVFNKRYIWAITIGCFIYNWLFSPMKAYDLTLGVLNTLVITAGSYFAAKYIKGYWQKLAVTPFIGGISMFIIAWELKLAFKLPFWPTYGTLIITEFVMIAIGAVLLGLIEQKLPEKYKLSK